MNQKITDELIKHISDLVMFELDEAGRSKARSDVESVLAQMDVLRELNLDDVEPMTHPYSLHNVFCEDVIRNGGEKEVLMSELFEGDIRAISFRFGKQDQTR